MHNIQEVITLHASGAEMYQKGSAASILIISVMGSPRTDVSAAFQLM